MLRRMQTSLGVAVVAGVFTLASCANDVTEPAAPESEAEPPAPESPPDYNAAEAAAMETTGQHIVMFRGQSTAAGFE